MTHTPPPPLLSLSRDGSGTTPIQRGGGIRWAVKLVRGVWRFDLAATCPTPNPGASCFVLPPPCALRAPCLSPCSFLLPTLPPPNGLGNRPPAVPQSPHYFRTQLIPGTRGCFKGKRMQKKELISAFASSQKCVPQKESPKKFIFCPCRRNFADS